MFSTNHNTQPALIYSVDGNPNLLHNLTRTENIDIEPNFTRNFSLNSFEQEQEPMDEINAFINQLKAEKESSMKMSKIKEDDEEER